MLVTIIAILAMAPDPKPVVPKHKIVEMRFIDDATLKLKMLDEKIDVITKYGSLQIPLSDIRRIDFGLRIPTSVAEEIASSVRDLGSPDYLARETAMETLKGHRERSIAACRYAVANSSDPEVIRRAEEIVKALQNRVPAELLSLGDMDVIHTDDSKIVGRIAATEFKVRTFQFGDVPVKLADVRQLKLQAIEEIRGDPAPTNLVNFPNQIGKEFVFSITGPPQGTPGRLWGTDVYTIDSELALAAVHAGIVKPGETVVVRVRIVASPPQYLQTLRNNIQSAGYGNYTAGAYEFLRK